MNGCFFYNCGPHSGFSQKHKHIQIFPSDAIDLPILQQLVNIIGGGNNQLLKHFNYKGNQITLFKGYEFIHGIITINPSDDLSVMA